MTKTIPPRFGDYEVLELLEDVAGVQIYAARQTSVDRLVSLTVLPPAYARKAEFVKRFERQLAAASRLSHPNVVQAIDAGSIEGHQYIASEFAGGANLADCLEEGQWFPARRCVAIGAHVARALEHLHGRGLVHRSLNPRAVLLAESGVAKLQGFSLSKLLGGSGYETWLDFDAYEARYMAPEQVLFEGRTDERSDLYGLASVLYHVVTGRPPFGEGTTEEIRQRVASGRPPDPGKLREDLPDGLRTVLIRSLARDPAARYPSATRLAEDLEALAPGAALPRKERKSPLRWLGSLFEYPE